MAKESKEAKVASGGHYPTDNIIGRSVPQRIGGNSVNKANDVTQAHTVPKSDTPSTRTFSTSTLNSALKRWYDLRDDNMHFEVRVSMSKFFRYDDLNKAYKTVLKDHDSGVRYDTIGYRNKLDNEFERRLKRDFGKKLSDRVTNNSW